MTKLTNHQIVVLTDALWATDAKVDANTVTIAILTKHGLVERHPDRPALSVLSNAGVRLAKGLAGDLTWLDHPPYTSDNDPRTWAKPVVGYVEA